MKTPANDQEQKPRAEARGAHAAWRVVKELESRLNPAGAGAKKKAAPGNTRDVEKRAVRALREVRATQRPSLEISRQASPGRRFGAWGLGRAPATAQGLLDRTPRGREGRAGIEMDAWAGLEPATSGLWARRADRCSTTRWVIRRPRAVRGRYRGRLWRRCSARRTSPHRGEDPRTSPGRRWRVRWRGSTRRGCCPVAASYSLLAVPRRWLLPKPPGYRRFCMREVGDP